MNLELWETTQRTNSNNDCELHNSHNMKFCFKTETDPVKEIVCNWHCGSFIFYKYYIQAQRKVILKIRMKLYCWMVFPITNEHRQSGAVKIEGNYGNYWPLPPLISRTNRIFDLSDTALLNIDMGKSSWKVFRFLLDRI